jgi:hypothetical protein
LNKTLKFVSGEVGEEELEEEAKVINKSDLEEGKYCSFIM